MKAPIGILLILVAVRSMVKTSYKAKLAEAKNIAQENSDILKEYDSFEWILDGIEAIEDAIQAKKLAWSGGNPVTYYKSSVTKKAKNIYRRNIDRAKKYNYYPKLSLSDPQQLEFIIRDYQEDVKNAALLTFMRDSFLDLTNIYPIELEEKPPLRYETILKFRKWIAENIKTPLAQIPNWKWNLNGGHDYEPLMLQLMYQALREAGVALEEVGRLTPKELEAILRARQYIYAASKRGYFLPYEYELYTLFKKLLMLTDYQAAKLLSLYIPWEKVAGGGGGTEVVGGAS